MRRISTGSPFEEKMAFSRAVVKGNWCFVAGVTGYDYTTMTMPDDVGAQTRNCLKTIQEVLIEAGFTLEDIVRVQHTVADIAYADEMAPVLRDVLGGTRPPATIVTAGLLRPEMKVEIEVTAMRK